MYMPIGIEPVVENSQRDSNPGIATAPGSG